MVLTLKGYTHKKRKTFKKFPLQREIGRSGEFITFLSSMLLKFFVKGHGLLLEFKIKNKGHSLQKKKKKNHLDPYFAPNKNLTPKVITAQTIKKKKIFIKLLEQTGDNPDFLGHKKDI